MYIDKNNLLHSKLFYEREDLEPFARDGGVWMDAAKPEWAFHVDADELEMSSWSNCILGQTLGYDDTLVKYGWKDEDGSMAQRLGFFIPSRAWYGGRFYDVAYEEGYAILDELWQEEIAKRLEGRDR